MAFLIGLLIVPAGLYMRQHLPETIHEADRHAATPGQRRLPARLVVLALVLMMASSIYIYGVDYVTTYAQDSLHLSSAVAFGATVVVGIAAVLADPLSGLLSDRIGRKPVMLGAVAILALLLVPAYRLMTTVRSIGVVYSVLALLGMLQAFLTAPALIAVTESLPRAVRSGSLAILYAVAISACGGTTQFAIKALTDLTGSALTPAWYMTGAVLAGGIAMALMRETAPVAAIKS
jgi:MFS transporter, MHS family, citrate/tricarballylate:H+ symporter